MKKEIFVRPKGWVGRRIIGDILVMDLTDRPSGRTRGNFYRCICTCGNIFTESRLNLLKGVNVSCGCKGNNGRTSKEYANWVREVKKACGNQCQACGSRGRDMVAHHILPWNQAVEVRYAPSNGMALCKSCHRQYHCTYGHQMDCNLKTLTMFNQVRRAVNSGAFSGK